MNSVVRIAEYLNRETVAVLQSLLGKAIRGEIAGIALCLKRKDGAEDVVFTGVYKAHPGEAAGTALKLSWRLTQAQDVESGPP